MPNFIISYSRIQHIEHYVEAPDKDTAWAKAEKGEYPFCVFCTNQPCSRQDPVVLVEKDSYVVDSVRQVKVEREIP